MKNIVKIVMMTSLISTASFSDEVKADSVNGAKLWADTCMRCHNLRAPDNLNKRAWKFSMQHMRVRAGLTGKETRDVLAFILESKTKQDTQ